MMLGFAMKKTFRMFNHIKYETLNKRQKENYNFQKIASKLADYGYNCLRLTDDWGGADFIAVHVDGHAIKVQLKSRLSIEKQYNGKEIYIAFDENNQWYIYAHDQLRDQLLNMGKMSGTKSWEQKGKYNWSSIPKYLVEHITQYAI